MSVALSPPTTSAHAWFTDSMPLPPPTGPAAVAGLPRPVALGPLSPQGVSFTAYTNPAVPPPAGVYRYPSAMGRVTFQVGADGSAPFRVVAHAFERGPAEWRLPAGSAANVGAAGPFASTARWTPRADEPLLRPRAFPVTFAADGAVAFPAFPASKRPPPAGEYAFTNANEQESAVCIAAARAPSGAQNAAMAAGVAAVVGVCALAAWAAWRVWRARRPRTTLVLAPRRTLAD